MWRILIWYLSYSFFILQNKDKLEKLRGQAETFCQRLGRYRMPFAWATVNIMEVISTATLDRDVTDSDSLKGGAFTCRDNFLRTAYRSVSDVTFLLFQVNPAASTGKHSCPGGIWSATTPLMTSFATFLHSNPLQSRSARSLSRFVNHILSHRGSG